MIMSWLLSIRNQNNDKFLEPSILFIPFDKVRKVSDFLKTI